MKKFENERVKVVPVVHLNGTAKEDLLQMRSDVVDILMQADKALAIMAPNGRDYYVTPGMMTLAETQHQCRQMALKSLIDEIQEEIDEIYFQ